MQQFLFIFFVVVALRPEQVLYQPFLHHPWVLFVFFSQVRKQFLVYFALLLELLNNRIIQRAPLSVDGTESQEQISDEELHLGFVLYDKIGLLTFLEHEGDALPGVKL